MEWKEIWRWCWRNLGNLALIGGWLVSAGFFPILLSTAQGVTPLGYGIASVAGLLSFAAGRAFWMAARNWRLDAKIKDRLSSDSSPFDPMATVFENKRIFLKDLAPAGRRLVLKKKFIDCEIIGPGNIVVALKSREDIDFPKFSGNTFHDVDCFEIEQKIMSQTAIYFYDCDIENCDLFQLSLLFYKRIDNAWNWMTPDFARPLAIEDKSNDEAK